MRERKTKTGLPKQAPPERSTGSLSLGPKGESLAWFYPHPLLRRAQERIHFWPRPSGKGLMEMLVANHTPFLGEETSIRRTDFALGLSRGFQVELGWADPYPFLLSPPPPSPAVLDCCDSRGYDRAVARAKYLLGILEPWISLPRPKSSKDKKTNVLGLRVGEPLELPPLPRCQPSQESP